MAISGQFIATVPATDCRMLMPRIRRDAFSGGDLKDAQPDRHKKARFIPFAKLIIHIGKRFSGTLTVLNSGFYQHTGYHHEQSRRNTFSGHVRHNQCDVIFIHQEEVIKISAYLFGRYHRCINIKFRSVRKGREKTRQLARLNRSCHIELCADPFFLSRNSLHLFYVLQRLCREFCKRLRQHFNLIPGTIGFFHLELKPVTAQ